MPKKRLFPIGTPTTTRKRAAISKARKGLLDTSSYEYVKAKYRAALFPPLRSRMYKDWWSDNDVWDFAEECVADAFTRINEYNPKYKFRSFMARIIIIPKLKELKKAKERELEGQKGYVQRRHKGKPLSAKNLADEIKPNMEKELVREAAIQFKAKEPLKYEVLIHRAVNDWEFPVIADELKITPANARQIYGRVIKQELPKIFSKLVQRAPYVDKDLKWRQKFLDLLTKIKHPKK